MGNILETIEGKERLSKNEIKDFTDAWLQMVLGHEEEFVENEAIAQFAQNPETLKSWLYETLMEGVKDVAKNWGIAPDYDRIQLMNKESDVTVKSKMQYEYLKDISSKISKRTENYGGRKNMRGNWDFTPAGMNETGQISCSSAMMLGSYLFQETGIENFLGRPAGHVLNIIQLENKNLYYADFLNNGLVRFYEGETQLKEIENTKVLELSDPRFEYHLIPLYKNINIVASVLINLDYFKQVSDNPSDRGENRRIKEIISRYQEHFDKVDFFKIWSTLYPDIYRVDSSTQMVVEEERIKKLHENEIL